MASERKGRSTDLFNERHSLYLLRIKCLFGICLLLFIIKRFTFLDLCLSFSICTGTRSWESKAWWALVCSFCSSHYQWFPWEPSKEVRGTLYSPKKHMRLVELNLSLSLSFLFCYYHILEAHAEPPRREENMKRGSLSCVLVIIIFDLLMPSIWSVLLATWLLGLPNRAKTLGFFKWFGKRAVQFLVSNYWI